MSEESTASKLSVLAQEFLDKLELYRDSENIKTYINNLNIRKVQINKCYDKTNVLINYTTCMTTKHIKHSIPKRKLSARIKNLSGLINEFQSSPKIIIQPKKFEVQDFEDTFFEIENKLKTVWQEFLNYDKRADNLIKLSDDDNSIENSVQTLNRLISKRSNLKSNLPHKDEDIDIAKQIKIEIVAECDKIEQKGFDEEISRFLLESRSDKGFPLKKLLESPKILKWLKEKGQTSSFRISRNIQIE